MADTQERDIAVSGKTKRILSFDIIRGFLLLVILVGHIELPPNFYDFFTGRGRLFVSAAEGFFFLSGLLVGMVYRRRVGLGMRFIFKKMWARAAELYVGSVVLTLVYAFIVAKTNHFYIKQGLPNPVDWPHTIFQTLLLRFEYGWADFLGRFAILMLIAPFIFYLVAKGRWKLVLAGIIGAYFFRGQNFTLGWQLLFNAGILMGFYWDEINEWWVRLKTPRKKLLKRSALAITAITFAYSYAVVYVLSEFNTFYNSLSHGWQHFTLSWDSFNKYLWTYADKWTMGPVRAGLFFVWGSVIFSWVRRHEAVINKRTKNLLLLVGQNSLFVYIYHSLLVFVFKFFIPARTNPWQNFAIVSLSLILLIGGTYLYRYVRNARPGLSSASLYSFVFKKGRTLFVPK
jgi:hypothetical protein